MSRFPNIASTLLPGNERWPAADKAIGPTWLSRIDPLVEELEAELAAAPSREGTITAFAARHRDVFEALLKDLYTAYYSTEAVQAVIVEIAEAGPREASPHFDATLVETVVREQRGLRRL